MQKEYILTRFNRSNISDSLPITPLPSQLDQNTPTQLNISYINPPHYNIQIPNESTTPNKRKPKAKVIFNLSCTKYSVVKELGRDMLQWELSHDFEKEWDIAWTDCGLGNAVYAKLKPYQKINFFPGVQCIARKDQLAKNLGWMQRKLPQEYNFFPETYILPAEYYEFKKQFTRDNKSLFIIKPQASCQGKGIFLTNSWTNVLKNGSYVAQRYLTHPFLLEGLKFDMRIYVLLASCDPLRIYIHRDGLARFATEPYQVPKEENLDDMCMHLTNYAINKDNPNFMFNNSAENDSTGHKRSLKALFHALEEQGHDTTQLWKEIHKIVVKTFCSVQPILSHNYKCRRLEESPSSMCFQVFGFDIILDDKLTPLLLEVNSSPSFTTDTPLDKMIKENVIGDALKLMNVAGEDRINYKKKMKADIEARSLTGKVVKPTLEEKQREYARMQRKVDEWESVNHGGYEKIFPLDEDAQANEEYNHYIQEARNCWFSLTGISNKDGKNHHDFWLSPKPSHTSNRTSTNRPQTSTPAPHPVTINSKEKETHFEESKSSNNEKSDISQQNKKQTTSTVPNSEDIQKEPSSRVDDLETINLEELEKFLDGIKQNLNKCQPTEEDPLNKKKNKGSHMPNMLKKDPNQSLSISKVPFIDFTHEPHNNTQHYAVEKESNRPSLPQKIILQKRGSERGVVKEDPDSKRETFTLENTKQVYKRLVDRRREHGSVNFCVPSDHINAIHIEPSVPHKLTLGQGKDQGTQSHLPKRFVQHFYKPDKVTYFTTRSSSKVRGQYATAEPVKETTKVVHKSLKKPKVVKSSKSYENLLPNNGKGAIYQPARPKLGNFIMPKMYETLSGHSTNKTEKSFGQERGKISWCTLDANGVRMLNKTLGPAAYMTNPK